MKLFPVLLCGSLVANVALVSAFVWRPALAPPAVRAWFESRAAYQQRLVTEQRVAERRAAQQRAVDHARAAAAEARLWSELKTDDLRALVQRLRAAGFPANVIRGVVAEEINRRFASRLAALDTPNRTEYWKPRAFGDPKLIEQRNELIRERARMMRDILGGDFLAGTGVDPSLAQRARFGDLPPAKIEMLQRIDDDYAEMASEVRAATQGIMLPEDRAKLAYLEQQKHADLAAILSPAELQDYEMRTSPITARLRPALTLMDANQDEFRAIYQVYQQYDTQLYPFGNSGGAYTADLVRQRMEAQQAIDAQLKSALGSDRAAEFSRDSSFDFQQLNRLAKAQGLPADAAVQAYNVRNETAQQSVQIAENATLSYDDKRAALKSLAQTARDQLVAALGPTAGANYARSAGWLQAISRGSSVTFSGTTTSFRSVAAPPPRH